MKRVQLLPCVAALVVASVIPACLDFDEALDTCIANERCEDPDGGTDGSAPDGSTDPDGGGDLPDAAGHDAGVSCDAGFQLLGEVCHGGWCWEHPLPHGNNLTSIHGSGETVWVGGSASSLLRIDGCAVKQVPLPESVWIEDVLAEPNGSAVVVGDRFLRRVDVNGAWTPIYSFDAGMNGTALARAPDATLLATTSSGVVVFVQPDGRVDVVPHSLGGMEKAAAGARRFWVVTSTGQVHASLYGEQSSLEHTPDPLESIAFRNLWTSPEDEVFFVGDDGALFKADGGQSLVRQSPNTSFTAGSTIQSLRTITGTSASHLIVAGVGGNAFESDGGTWSRSVRNSSGGNVTNYDYTDSWTSPSGDPWLVAQGGVIATRQDGGWFDVRSRIAPYAIVRLNAVVVSGSEKYALGDESRLLRQVDGRWVSEKLPGSRNIRAAAPLPDGGVVVGGDESLFGEYGGGQFNALQFTLVDGGSSAAETFTLLEFARVSGGTTEWALGRRTSGTLLLRNDGTGWKEHLAPEPPADAGTWNAIAAESSTRALLGSTAGALGWVELGPPALAGTVAMQTPPSSPGINDIAVTPAGIFVAGTGFIRRVVNWETGVTANVTAAISSIPIHDSVVTSSSVIYVGGAGRIFVLNPQLNDADDISRATHWELRSVDVAPDGTVYAVGANGVVLRRSP